MQRFKAIAACLLTAACLVPSMAVAQAQSVAPRIVMRRPLNPSSSVPGSVTPACGTEGQPACPTDCEFVGATWEVGRWAGDACGQGGTVTRDVRCVAVRASGERVPRDDAFCLQDASSFHSNCNAPSDGTVN